MRIQINPHYPTDVVRLEDGRMITKGVVINVPQKLAKELLAVRRKNLPLWVKAQYDPAQVDEDADNAESTEEAIPTTDGEE